MSRLSEAEFKEPKVKKGELKPVILVPTPAQLARGERVIDAEPEIWPAAVKAMVKKAGSHGWGCRVTYSQFLDIPPVSGKNVGEWVTKHCLRVRTWLGDVAAEGTWIGAEADGWKPDTAQAYHRQWGLSVPFGVKVMGELLDGTMVIARDERGFAHAIQAGL